MRARFRIAVAVVAVLAAPASTPAFVGHDDVVYPLRYQVTALATFSGIQARFNSNGFDAEHVHDRRVEHDVLSFDSPTEFHWETTLSDGTLLTGNWKDSRSRWKPFHAKTSTHHEIAGGVFPYNHHSGICRAGIKQVWLSRDLSKLRGHGSYRVVRDLVSGFTRFSIKGTRL